MGLATELLKDTVVISAGISATTLAMVLLTKLVGGTLRLLKPEEEEKPEGEKRESEVKEEEKPKEEEEKAEGEKEEVGAKEPEKKKPESIAEKLRKAKEKKKKTSNLREKKLWMIRCPEQKIT